MFLFCVCFFLDFGVLCAAGLMFNPNAQSVGTTKKAQRFNTSIPPNAGKYHSKSRANHGFAPEKRSMVTPGMAWPDTNEPVVFKKTMDKP